MNEHPEHESPYPHSTRSGCDPRVDGLEHRMALQEAARVEIVAQTAALTEGQRMMREDVRDLIGEMRKTNDTINSVNDRVDKKFRSVGVAIWAVVVLLVPTVISLIGLWQSNQ